MNSSPLIRSYVVPSLVSVTVRKLVIDIYEYQNSNQKDEQKFEQSIGNIPSSMWSSILTEYHNHCIISFQTALSKALVHDTIQEFNQCPSCGDNDVLDLHELKQVVMNDISRTVSWRVSRREYELFLKEIEFGNYQCSLDTLKCRFRKHFNVSSFSWTLEQFLIDHGCCYISDKMVSGLKLGERVSPSEIYKINYKS